MNHADDFHDFVRSHGADKRGDSFHASGSTRVHYGLSNPTMRGFVKTWAAAHPDLTFDDWRETLDALYQAESIDEACMAGFMLGHYGKFRRMLPLATLDSWIGHLQGWREIDTTCQSNFSAKEVLNAWHQWEPFLVDLSKRETIQHRRASLVLLVKPVRESSDSRLIAIGLANVERLKHETDKLITKAISWLLRQAIKQHREAVAAYVVENEASLPRIAVREFHKKLETGKK